MNDCNAMKPSSKVILVFAAYGLALLIASLVVNLYIATTNGPDRQAYSTMFDFGDSLLFLGVFALAAIPATATALFFLRPYPTFWRVASLGALAIATTGAAALSVYLLPAVAGSGAYLSAWSELSPLRILLAPLFALAFFVLIVFAPTRSSRLAFLCASVIETIVFVWVALIWFQPFH
jgi:hypothetical protein